MSADAYTRPDCDVDMLGRPKPKFEIHVSSTIDIRFFTLAGAKQWLSNERAEGRHYFNAKIYDIEKGEYVQS